MNILIIGLGYVGTYLAERALLEQHQVTGVRRQDKFPQGIRGVAIDVAQAKSLDALPSQPEAIAYLVGADSHSEEAYRAAYQATLQRVVERYAPRLRSGATRLVFASSTAVYGASDGDTWVDEQSPALAETFSARILREAERMVWDHGGVVLRLGGIYGPERTSFMQRVARRELTSANAATRFTNRIHQVDAARAMLHLTQLPDPQPLYLGVDEAPAAQCDVVAWLEAELGAVDGLAKAPPAPDSRSPVIPAATPVAVQQPGAGWPSAGRVVANKRCSSKLLRETGFTFKYPSFREGYAPLIAHLTRAASTKNS